MQSSKHKWVKIKKMLLLFQNWTQTLICWSFQFQLSQVTQPLINLTSLSTSYSYSLFRQPSSNLSSFWIFIISHRLLLHMMICILFRLVITLKQQARCLSLLQFLAVFLENLLLFWLVDEVMKSFSSSSIKISCVVSTLVVVLRLILEDVCSRRGLIFFIMNQYRKEY